jgi:hypothetical protein
VQKFNTASMPDLLFLLGKVGAGPRITDIRWSAYILATAFIESSHTVRITKQTVDKKGRVKTHKIKVWRNFAPVEETGHGKGRRYALAVKVKRLPSGDAQVTEYDGDQWVVSAATGIGVPVHRHEKLGVKADAKPSNVYDDDDGDEQFFFGRGYVQLTWWTNYAAAGVALGQGLALLFDPDLVNDPNTAYSIFATGLYTGGIFANGRKLSQYFHGGHTDYVNARNMVNAGVSQDAKVEVAKIAERFEKALFASRLSAEVAAR